MKVGVKERLLTPARWLQWGELGRHHPSPLNMVSDDQCCTVPGPFDLRQVRIFICWRGGRKKSKPNELLALMRFFLNSTFLSLPSLLKVYVYVAMCQFLLINNRPWKEGTYVFHIYFISIMISLSRQSAHI